MLSARRRIAAMLGMFIAALVSGCNDEGRGYFLNATVTDTRSGIVCLHDDDVGDMDFPDGIRCLSIDDDRAVSLRIGDCVEARLTYPPESRILAIKPVACESR